MTWLCHWLKNRLWNWLDRSSYCLFQFISLSSPFSNFYILGTFLMSICHSIYKTSLPTLCFEYFHFHCFATRMEFLCTYWKSKCFRRQQDDSEGSEIISAHFDFFWQNHSSIIYQIWLHFLQSHLFNSNKIVMPNKYWWRTRFAH